MKSGEAMKPLAKISDLAAYLNVHEATIYRWIKAGTLPGVMRINNGHWRFDMDVIEEWVASSAAARVAA